MARIGKRASDMPAMTARIPEPLTYDYEPVRVHLRLGQRMLEQPHPATELFHPSAAAGSDLCWSGYCNKGCGRTLISATTPTRYGPGWHACGICE